MGTGDIIWITLIAVGGLAVVVVRLVIRGIRKSRSKVKTEAKVEGE